jgi:regulator of replication initiation timing
MTTNMQAPPEPKAITVEDVHKMLGQMMLQIEMLRRENETLRTQLAEKT